MLALLKREYHSNKGAIITILLVTVLFSVYVQQELVLIIGMLGLAISLFYDENKAKVTRFVASLPVEKNMIVRSRYAYILFMTSIILCLQWVIAVLLKNNPWINQPHVFTWTEAIIILSASILVSAICLPVYYWFRSFNLASFIVLILCVTSNIFIVDALLTAKYDKAFENFEETGYVEISVDSSTIYFTEWIEQIIPYLPYVWFPLLAIAVYMLSMKLSEQFITRRYV
ncbi:ABC-2 transporter permease [Radiobacillus sp. PE A8.2]|uniref:ABC-2 transporter permease n=1 Tax=Radiobacillus sp. PE A8.2 TaxID=3380349 RepID=UPI00388E1D6D